MTVAEKFEFQAEVSRLLKLMAHSVYSEKEVFLRELISNAADACDKLRYLALTQPNLTDGDAEFHIQIAVDKDAKTLSVTDNGVGMDRADLIDHLGTIAKSGTAKFIEALESGESSASVSQIGQFGVGFYSVFMVADKVEVSTRKAGSDAGFLWISDGGGAYEISEIETDTPTRGTTVTLHINDDSLDFLEEPRLQHIIKTYSDHVPIPITLSEGAAEGAQVNAAKALWMRAKSEISEDDYKQFYNQVCGGYDDPARIIHYRAEGRQEYTALLYIPSMAPFDLYDPARKGRVKLYVKRVAITDDAELLPPYLRFIRGVVDSEDMPLNISREMLQNNPLLGAIRKALAKKVLSELGKFAEKEEDGYKAFWESFGAVLKEGVYEDPERREDILKLARFKSTSGEGWRSLAAYIADKPESQKAIYFLHGENKETLAASPVLEAYRARGIEVLLLSEPVDAFWTTTAPAFEGLPIKPVSSGGEDLESIPRKDKDTEEAEEVADDQSMDTLIAAMKTTLGEAVADIKRSALLVDSPACLAAQDEALNMQLSRMMGKTEGPRVLELNPHHALIRELANRAGNAESRELVETAARVLLGQAELSAGVTPSNLSAFSADLTRLLEGQLSGRA